jgi:L-cystine uptake protein TcyP (sodium:dicarboxylate symporter family)
LRDGGEGQKDAGKDGWYPTLLAPKAGATRMGHPALDAEKENAPFALLRMTFVSSIGCVDGTGGCSTSNAFLVLC